MTTRENQAQLAWLRKLMEDADRLKREDPEAFEAQRLEKLPWTRCAMCRVDFKGYGNNAQPILAGKVCDDCNITVLKQRRRDMDRE